MYLVSGWQDPKRANEPETKNNQQQVRQVCLNSSLKHLSKDDTMKELEMRAIPWLNIDDGILRLREIAMLE